MNLKSPVCRPPFGKILAVLLLLLALFGLAVADCFRMDADGQALRDALKRGSGASSSRVFQGAVGPVLLAASRLGLRFADDVPAEAHRGVSALRGARVSVDHLENRIPPQRQAEMIREADRVMNDLGWERLVCVRESDTLVVVYLDATQQRGTTVQTRLAVLDSDQLVIVSARIRLQPLLDLGIDAMNRELAANDVPR
jgi:hypothetical protein